MTFLVSSFMKPVIVRKPWGSFSQFSHNEPTTVKILSVKPRSKLSLQFHEHRDEFWKVLDGSGQVVVGDDVFDVKPDDEFFIPRGTKHRIVSFYDELRVLEISYGDFDEKDIVRLEDDYDRA